MNDIPVYDLTAKQRLIMIENFFLKTNDKPDRELFNKIYLNYGHANAKKIDLYWSVMLERLKGNSMRDTGAIVGRSGNRIMQIERKLIRAIKSYERKVSNRVMDRAAT